MSTTNSTLHRANALGVADSLLDEYHVAGATPGERNVIRHLLTLAYLRGGQDGSRETMALVERELEGFYRDAV